MYSSVVLVMDYSFSLVIVSYLHVKNGSVSYELVFMIPKFILVSYS